MPPAVTILPSPAMTSVPGPMTMSTPGWMSGLPALPMPAMRPSLRPISAFTMPQWSRISALVMTVSTAPWRARALALAHAVADHLAAAELHLLAVGREVLLDLDEQLGVGQPHAVARRSGRTCRHRPRARCASGHRWTGRPWRSAPSLPVDLALEAVALARRPVGHEPHLARLAGLEAHGGAGGDVEPHALGALAVEVQRRVGLEEMIVAADLDRPVAGVGDLEGDRVAARVELDLARAATISPGIMAALLSGSGHGR